MPLNIFATVSEPLIIFHYCWALVTHQTLAGRSGNGPGFHPGLTETGHWPISNFNSWQLGHDDLSLLPNYFCLPQTKKVVCLSGI